MKNNLIRYSNCWEDTDNLLGNLNESKKVLSICSGGDNTFAMLLNNPQKIVAFDLNINQIYLAKLKACAFKYLTYSELLILLGITKGNSYEIFSKLKSYLDNETYNFFETNKMFFKKGIIHIGKFEHFFQIFKNFICPLFASKKNIYKLASFDDINEQKNFYEKVINNKRLNFLFKIFFGFKSMGKLGRDISYYNYIDDKENSALDIKKRFDEGITTIINKNNSYINYILLNKFSKSSLPVYLKEENFNKIKKNIDRVEFIQGSFLDMKGKYDFFNLSDIFEYMNDEDFKVNVNHLDRISNDGSVLIYYNMQGKRYLNNTSFILNKKKSDNFYKTTKSYFYRNILIYEKRNVK